MSRTVRGPKSLELLDLEQEPSFLSGLLEFVVRGYGYQSVVDIFAPHLTVVSNFGDIQVVPFLGLVIYQLSRDRFCESCFCQVDLGEGLCSSCRKELGLEFLQCVKIGPGFGTQCCDLADPPCHSEFSQSYCQRSHVLYIAAFDEEIIKIGMSREDRVYFRLVEQGAISAMIFQHPSKCNFVETHLLEQDICKNLGLRDFLVFEDKIEIFSRCDFDFHSIRNDLRELGDVLRANYGLQMIEHLDFVDEYCLVSDVDVVEKEPLVLDGIIVGFRGNIAYLESRDSIMAFDMNRLQGRKLLNISG